MEGNKYNFIELSEKEGIGKIKIDGTELKAISDYKVKRDTDIVELTITISVPPKNFNTTLSP